MSKDKFVTDSLAGITVTRKTDTPATESAKVTKSLEEALAQVQLEWIEE